MVVELGWKRALIDAGVVFGLSIPAAVFLGFVNKDLMASYFSVYLVLNVILVREKFYNRKSEPHPRVN